MLPFLKNKQKQQTGVIVQVRAKDDADKPESEDDPKAAMKSAAQDLHDAIKSGDIDGIASALQSAFELADSEPHEEGPHVEKHSFEDQNQAASEE
jgi:hypothetical protein